MPFIHATNISLSYPVFARAPRANAGKISAEIDANAAPLEWLGAGAVMPASRRAPSQINALQNVNFDLTAGDRLAIVGRNGSGKSTLLRVLAGVYPPSTGRLEVQGRIAPMFNVGLGVRQEATGRRNIILRGIMNGLSRSESEAKVREIIEFSELGPYIDLPVRTYSSGMAMRLAFATATAFSPEVLLLDEWIGAGDEDFQKKAAARMMSLVEQSGITVIASHRRQLLKQVCNYALWIESGVQRAFGPLEEVFQMWDDAYLERLSK
jgi:homopolymeric O-antigen transport system ATP-binding protein